MKLYIFFRRWRRNWEQQRSRRDCLWTRSLDLIMKMKMKERGGAGVGARGRAFVISVGDWRVRIQHFRQKIEFSIIWVYSKLLFLFYIFNIFFGEFPYDVLLERACVIRFSLQKSKGSEQELAWQLIKLKIKWRRSRGSFVEKWNNMSKFSHIYSEDVI